MIRGATLWVGKGRLERAIQQLYPLELSCDIPVEQASGETQLNPEAHPFRPRRGAAAAANLRMQDISEYEHS